MVGLLDVCSHGQSDVTSAERRGLLCDLWFRRFLQSGEEVSQWGWCVVSSFASLSLSLSQSKGSSLQARLPAFKSGPAVEKFVFYIVFLFWSDQIGSSLFFTAKVTDWLKNDLLIIFIFWRISSTFRYALILCTEGPFSILKKISASITSLVAASSNHYFVCTIN